MLRVFSGDCRAWTLVEVGSPVLDRAGALLRRHALRGADAIQLASALYLRDKTGTEVAFGGFDGRLGEAALAEGFTLLT